jgi:integrase
MKGSVRQLRDGGWLADVTVNGTRRTARASTKIEAQAHRRAINEQLSRAAALPPARGSFTFQQALDLSATIRWAGTKGERTSLINARAAVAHFGAATQLSSVTAPAVDQWRQAMLRQGKRPATINHKLSALRGMLSDAVLHGHLDAAPQMPRQLRADNHRDRVLEDWERDALLEWLVRAGEPAAADLMVFLLETAVRWGEAERLKGKDVDMERGRVTLWQTKSGRPRTVPLTRRAQDAIRSHLPAVRTHRVWPFPYHTFRRLLERAKDGCGLADESIGIHTMRHTCASKLATAGVSLAQIMAFGGWSSLSAVQRYLHLNTDTLHGCIAALEQ